jgi:cation diffusion facilitator CzcD-associated flavoprotein CzcO
MSSPAVVVIGAGFGGLGVAHALREAGIDDVTILERADDVGGVWRDNTYPGAACDVPTPLYSWSWAPNPEWGRRYGPQPEILAYLRSAAERDGLLDLVRTGVDVKAAEYDDSRGRWRVTTADGEVLDADVVISAVGQLANPVVPQIAGAETFAGPAFHSAQWRHDVDLTGRRVAVVGTGASAIQFVPGIVDRVGSLTVFQRSAPYVVPKPDQAYGPRHHAVFRRWPRTQRAERRSVFWLSEKLNAALGGDSWLSGPGPVLLRAAFRLQLRRQVRDAALRRKLLPDYPIGCKRLLFSNDWYPALARDHVEVVTDRVTGIEPGGLRTADGRLHEADVLIWGTGFAATRLLDVI